MRNPSDKINDTLSTFNPYHPRLQFTSKLENDNRISFLDVSLIRGGRSIVTNWNRKATFSSRMLHFHSTHPLTQKRAMVFNLVDRAVSISQTKFHKETLDLVRSLLCLA